MRTFVVLLRFGLLALAGLIMLLPGVAQQSPKPHKVKIVGDKNDKITGGVTPLDPTPRVAFPYKGGFALGVSAEKRNIADNIVTLFLVDGRIVNPTRFGKKQQQLQNLADGPSGKKRFGGQTTWEQDGIRVTLTLEAVPGKRYQAKATVPTARRLDTLLVKYNVENTSYVAHKFGCRAAVNNSTISQPGLKYHSPTTHPGQTLLGVILEKKGVPEFIEALEKDDLKDPGFKATMTFKFGERLEGPGKIVLTREGLVEMNQWDIDAEAGVFSYSILYWDERILQPRAKRELAFAYGMGIAKTNEGHVSADLSGSFDPGKLFTVTAYVDGPLEGQSLTLQLPKGIERVDGKATQFVPPESEIADRSVVMWRCRVTQAGTYPISIRSNNGVTQTWMVTVSPPD